LELCSSFKRGTSKRCLNTDKRLETISVIVSSSLVPFLPPFILTQRCKREGRGDAMKKN